MKKNLKVFLGMFVLVVFAITTAFTISGEREEILEIGAEAPKVDMPMTDVSGEKMVLKEIADENGLLVIFSCNTCPFVVGNGTKSEGWEGRYPGLYDVAKSAGIGMVLVNSNEAKRNAGDGMEDMKARYKEEGLKGPYVLDEKHVLADAFGALTTPHVFLFNADMKLIYKGAIDDSVGSAAAVKDPYLLKAIKAHVSGDKIEPNSTKQLGCSIKRVKA